MPIHAHFVFFLGGEGIMTSNVGQTDLVFSLLPEFISRSVHARLHVCAVVTICATLFNIQTDIRTTF